MDSTLSQPGILAPPPPLGRSLTFRLPPDTDPRPALRRLHDGFSPDWGVVGLGEPLIRALGQEFKALWTFSGFSGAACTVPSTQ